MLVHWLSWKNDFEVTTSDPWMTHINHVISCDVSLTQQGEIQLYVLGLCFFLISALNIT